MELFLIFLYLKLIVYVHSFRNGFIRDLNYESTDINIDLNQKTTNKLFLCNINSICTNNFTVSGCINSSESNLCTLKESNKYICSIKGTHSKTELKFIMNEPENETYYLNIYLISYPVNNKNCLLDGKNNQSITLNFPDSSISPSNLSLSFGNYNLDCKTTLQQNDYDCYFILNNDSIIKTLSANFLNVNNTFGDKVENLKFEYFFFSLPTISDFYYTNKNSQIFYLNFFKTPYFLTNYSIQIGNIKKNIQSNSQCNMDLSSLNDQVYSVILVSLCNNEFNIGNIRVIKDLKINISPIHIERKKQQNINIFFLIDNFYLENKTKIKINDNVFTINSNNSNYYFTTNNNLSEGTYNISIYRNNNEFNTVEKLFVHEPEKCILNNDIIAFNSTEISRNITFEFSCLLQEVFINVKGEFEKLKCENKSTTSCNYEIDAFSSIINVKIITWTEKIIPVKIIKYSFDKECTDDIEKPIHFIIEHPKIFENENFKLEINEKKNYSHTEKTSFLTKFKFSNAIEIENITIIYSEKRITQFKQKILISNLSITEYFPSFISPYFTINTLIIFVNSSKKMKTHLIKLKSYDREIFSENLNCINSSNKNYICTLENYDFKGIKIGKYSLYLNDNCKNERLVGFINVEIFEIQSNGYFQMNNNTNISLGYKTNSDYFKGKGQYFININDINKPITINNDKITFQNFDVNESIYDIVINYTYNNYSYKYNTNSTILLFKNHVEIGELDDIFVNENIPTYKIQFNKNIFEKQIISATFNNCYLGVIYNNYILFFINQRFTEEKSLPIHITLFNNTIMNYTVNVKLKEFFFENALNFIDIKNSSIILLFDNFNDNDKFYQNNQTINCSKLDSKKIICKINNSSNSICYHDTNCKEAGIYFYDLNSIQKCNEGIQILEFSITTNNFTFILKNLETNNTSNFILNNNKYQINLNGIESGNYSIIVNNFTKIGESFEIFQKIYSKKDNISVNINTKIITFDLKFDKYISNKLMKFYLGNKVESKICFFENEFIICQFDLKSLETKTYKVSYKNFCSENSIPINLSVIIEDDVIIKHKIEYISKNWIVPIIGNYDMKVKYLNSDSMKINSISLIDSNKNEYSGYNITKNDGYIDFILQINDSNISNVFYIKTQYTENEFIFTEISDNPYYIVISENVNFTLNRHYFLKTNINQELNVSYNTDIKIENIYLFQSNIYYNFQDRKININNFTPLEGTYNLSFDICNNCPKHFDLNNKIVIHSNQNDFFQEIEMKNCLYYKKFDYIIKINKKDDNIDLEQLQVLLKSDGDSIVLEQKENQIYTTEEGKITSNTNFSLEIQENNTYPIFSSNIKFTDFSIKSFFYISKGIPFSNAYCNLDYLNISLGNYNLTYKYYDEIKQEFYYNYSDIKFGTYELNVINFNISKKIFASNDLENSKFILNYGELSNETNNTIYLVNQDYYLENLKTIFYYLRPNKKDLNNTEIIFNNNRAYFILKPIEKNEAYIITTIISKDNISKQLIEENIVGYYFFISSPNILIENNTKEFKDISLNFRNSQNASNANITVDVDDIKIGDCKVLNEMVFCNILLDKTKAKEAKIKVNENYYDSLFISTYHFDKDSICQTNYTNQTLLKDIKIFFNPAKNYKNITIKYDSINLTQKDGAFILEKSQISKDINFFDFFIEGNFVKKAIDVIKFYDIMNVSNPDEKIVIYKKISENYKNITFDFFDNSTEYKYYLYKDNHSIPVEAKKTTEDKKLEFKFNLFNISQTDKDYLEEINEISLVYKDKCDKYVELRKINLETNEIKFKIGRQFLSPITTYEAKIIVYGNKSNDVKISLNYSGGKIEMSKNEGTNQTEFIYTFNNDSLSAIYNTNCSLFENIITCDYFFYFSNKDLIEINETSTYNCFFNINEVKIILVGASFQVNFDNVYVYFIDNNDNIYNFERNEEKYSLNTSNLSLGKTYTLQIYEGEFSKNNLINVIPNYTYINVSIPDFFFIGNLSFEMDCEAKVIELTDDNDIIYDCYYENNTYECNDENISYGFYNFKLDNIRKKIFISKYLYFLDNDDLSYLFKNNTFNITLEEYYIPLIINFSIYKDQDIYGTYTREGENEFKFITYVPENKISFYLDIQNEYNYYLKEIYDDYNSSTIEYKLTEDKFSIETELNHDYVNKNKNISNLTIYFKVNHEYKSPEDLNSIVVYDSKEQNQTNISVYFEKDKESEGKVYYNISVKYEPLNLKIEYKSEHKGINNSDTITIHRYLMDTWICESITKKRVNLSIFNLDNKYPNISENDEDVNFDEKEKIAKYSFLINKSKNNISIEMDNELYDLNLENEKKYVTNNIKDLDNILDLEIGRIYQNFTIEFIHKNISESDIYKNQIFFKNINTSELIQIENYKINNGNLDIIFNISKAFSSKHVYSFFYINLCGELIASNNFAIKDPLFKLNEVNGTLVLGRKEEELFLNFTQEILEPNQLQISIIDQNEKIINSSECFNGLNKLIICQFNLELSNKNEIQYKLSQYTYMNKSYSYNQSIEVISKPNCSEGLLYDEINNCVLPEEENITVDLKKQYNFCKNGKGYCEKDLNNNYICNCKKNYSGLYCEYTADKDLNGEDFENTISNLNESLKNNSYSKIENLVLIKKIIYTIEKGNFIETQKLINTLDKYKILYQTIPNYYNNTVDPKYIIYPFDFVLYLMKNFHDFKELDNIILLLNKLVNLEYHNTSKLDNQKKISNLTKFIYSFYNNKDDYYPRFDLKNNKINFVKLVIPRNYEEKNNQSERIYITKKLSSISMRNLENKEKPHIYFSVDSLIDEKLLEIYFKYSKFNITDIFKSNLDFFKSCYSQNNKEIPLDFPFIFRQNIFSNKTISPNIKNCKYQKIINVTKEKNYEIEFECEDLKDLEEGFYFYIKEEKIKINEEYFQCIKKSDIFFDFKNPMLILLLIILILYIIYIIMIQIIFDLILIGIHNDGLDQSQKKIPESTEMSSAINEEDFDEEENVKVRQTRATYIELKVKNTLGEIFMQNLFQLNPIFSSFRPNILSGMIFKFSLFILNIFLICFSNAYFYSEDLFEKRIELFVNKYSVQSFLYPFSHELVKIIISSIIPLPIVFFINFIILTKYETKNTLADAISGTSLELERKDIAKDFKNKIRIRKIFAYIIIYSLSIFSIGYSILFCSYYQRTRDCYIFSVIWSLIIWFILNLIYIGIVSKFQNKGNESKVYYLKRLNMFN